MESIIQPYNTFCFICGNPNTEVHHIFNKYDRDKSTKYGLLVYLCPEHHRGSKGAHGTSGNELNRTLKMIGQRAFEEHYPDEDFRLIFGRSYL